MSRGPAPGAPALRCAPLLLLAIAGCDALIGLGDEPSGAAAATSTSSGDPGATTTTTGTSTSTAAEASSSSGGGAGDGGSGPGGGGPGTGGATGAGGEGGATPRPPCGELDEPGGECIEPGDGFCRVRRWRKDGIVASPSTNHYVIANRMGRGVAVVPDAVVFSVAESDPLSRDKLVYRVYRLDRATGDIAPRDTAFEDLVALTAHAGRVAIGEAGGVDGAGSGREGYLDFDREGWPIEEHPRQVDDDVLPQVGDGGRLWGGGRIGGVLHELTPLADPAPCDADQGEPLGSSIFDLRVVRVGGVRHLLTTNLEPGTVFLTRLEDTPCVAGDTEVRRSASGHAYAATNVGTRLFAKVSSDGGGQVKVVEVTDGGQDGASIALSVPTRGLATLGADLLIPRQDPEEGGLWSCSVGAVPACTSPAVLQGTGVVSEIEPFPGGLVVLGYDGDEVGTGDAVITCIDTRPE